jgi:hypothetical protein
MWIELIWLRIVISGGPLWAWQWTFGFHKMLKNPWIAEQLLGDSAPWSNLVCRLVGCWFVVCSVGRLVCWLTDWLIALWASKCLNYMASNIRMTDERWIENIWENQSRANQGIVPKFVWRDWAIPRKTSIRTTVIPTGNRTENPPNKCPGSYGYPNPIDNCV